MPEPVERFKMETNFEGLIQLLARGLYSEPDVFVRELIQNAHDSIVRRREVEPHLAGRIDIDINPTARTIKVRDNGIGMDRQDIRQFLSVIGSTGTGTARQQLQEEGRAAAYQLIGQFGIGMLSAFVVAEKVVVHTRKRGASEAFAWHNTGSTDCELYSDSKAEVGSNIVVTVNPMNSFVLDEKRLREALIKYCDFIPFPICLSGVQVNTVDAPWHREHWASPAEKEASYNQFLNRRYPDVPLDVIPIEIDMPYRARGALYISDRHVPDMNTTGVMDIFVRRMFVRAGDNTLLPTWAKFMRGLIDSPDLNPTAARDNVRRDDVFTFLQKRLGELIVERLSYLARNEPRKFLQINRWHHYHLKGMAYFHDDFFEQVADLLLFETNRGPLSLQEYLTKNAPRPATDNKAPIYYFAYAGASAQFYRLADARDWVVINAGERFDEELLEKYGRLRHRAVHLMRLDATDDPELFQRLDASEQERFRQFELDMEGHLRRVGLPNVAVRMRRFAPAELPAVIILTPETEAEEKLRNLVTQPWFMQDMEDVAREMLNQNKRTLYLSLNVDNALIQKLAESNRREETVQEVMLGIYNSAALYSHNLLTQHNSNIIHAQVVRLLERLMDSREQLATMTRTLEQERGRMLELRQRQATTDTQHAAHIMLFMITPFADAYRPVEQAVRRVFERPPYCFQVWLDRDYTHDTRLLANLRRQMLQAHGFIAEITDQNPNVMFELGAAMMPDDARPIFTLRRRDATLDVPADFRETLFVLYGTLNDPPAVLEADIRAAFERDGRIIHAGIKHLLAQRTKHFLSRTLVEDLSIRLKPEQMNSLMNQYHTIEDLLAAAETDIARACGLAAWQIQAIRGELQALIGSSE